MVKSKKILWIVRSCFIVITITVFVLSYYYYVPVYYPFSYLDQRFGQMLLYGGILFGITVFTWIFPVPGSIIAILYGVMRLVDRSSGGRFLSNSSSIYYLVYGIFLAVAVVYLIIGLKQDSTRVKRPLNKKLLWRVRIITIAALAVLIVVYTIIYPEWWGIVIFVLTFLTFGIAWLWPTAGGFLMLLVGIPAFYNLYDSNYDFQIKLPAYILCLIFIASGFAHIAISMEKRRASKRGEGIGQNPP